MERRWRLFGFAVVLLIVLVLGADWAVAQSRLGGVVIQTSIEPPQAIADGKTKVVLTVRITEGGQPRANDLLQLWLGKGGGLLIPSWTYTDAQGMAQITYTPNPLSQYDLQNVAEIHVMDTSIGRLIEVDKRQVIAVPLVSPAEP